MAGVMCAFQIKNLADTFWYGDGVVFVVHHVVTISVAVLSMQPYSHFYGTFFFGVSEASTAVLSVLANFDEQHGLLELATNYPTLKLLTGALFIVSFVLIRCVLWPVLTYFYVKDALLVLEAHEAHNARIVWTFVVALSVLSVLQVIWLGEIGATVRKELAPLFAPAKSKAH